MRALVTGGAGFIGSNIVKLLVEKGYEVVILDDLSSGYRTNVQPAPNVEFVEGDIRTPGVAERTMPMVDVIFHLASSVGNLRAIEDPIADSMTNVIGTLNVLEAARKCGVRKLVYSSSAAIFGELRLLPIKEDHPAEPDSPYGASKLAAEKHCLCYARLHNIEVICLRYFNVYGPNQRFDAYGNVIPKFANQLLDEVPLLIYGDGEQTRDFINVRDVAQANLLAARCHGISGAFNLGSSTSVTINQLAEWMQEAAGIRVGVKYCPPRQGDVRHSKAEIHAIQSVLKFYPTVSLRDGLKEYMAWFSADRAGQSS
jgi:UDP-glucose 4-epimerase